MSPPVCLSIFLHLFALLSRNKSQIILGNEETQGEMKMLVVTFDRALTYNGKITREIIISAARLNRLDTASSKYLIIQLSTQLRRVTESA